MVHSCCCEASQFKDCMGYKGCMATHGLGWVGAPFNLVAWCSYVGWSSSDCTWVFPRGNDKAVKKNEVEKLGWSGHSTELSCQGDCSTLPLKSSWWSHSSHLASDLIVQPCGGMKLPATHLPCFSLSKPYMAGLGESVLHFSEEGDRTLS